MFSFPNDFQNSFKRPCRTNFFFGLGSRTSPEDSVSFRIDDLLIKTKVKEIPFRIEIAETQRQRAKGLMWRKHLNNDAGMLFDFKTTDYILMWMKDTYISLDMLFITENGLIRNIERNTIPHSTKPIKSKGPVRAVLELTAGTAEKHGIRNGDTVIYSIFKP